MNSTDTVRILSTLVTRDDAGRHFTERLGGAEIAALEADGLIEVTRPVHRAGIPYAEEHWTVRLTPEGEALVLANPESWAVERPVPAGTGGVFRALGDAFLSVCGGGR